VGQEAYVRCLGWGEGGIQVQKKEVGVQVEEEVGVQVDEKEVFMLRKRR
jgi:hypothetical protein